MKTTPTSVVIDAAVSKMLLRRNPPDAAPPPAVGVPVPVCREFLAAAKKHNYDNRHPGVHGAVARYVTDLLSGRATRGLLLCGATGTGKTLALRVIELATGVKRLTAMNLYRIRLASGWDGVREEVWSSRYFSAPPCAPVIVDEVGFEPTLTTHGATIEPFAELCDFLYESWRYKGGRHICIATNLIGLNLQQTADGPLDDFGRRYGMRVVSRLREACTWIANTAPDQRGVQ